MNINVKDFASTETKSCIGAEIGMFVNGSVFDDFLSFSVLTMLTVRPSW